MTPQETPHPAPDALPRMPGWISAARWQNLCGQGAEETAFLSGAALAHLHLVAATADLPQALWRARLALAAAEACAGIAGRPERAAELRDALHFLRPGDHPGPAGAVFRQWVQAVARPVSGDHPGGDGMRPEWMALCRDARGGNPVAGAARVIGAVLTQAPRAETAALILADAALARAAGWHHVLPLLAIGLQPRDLRQRGDDLRLACHRALVVAAGQAVALAADLTRRAARLQAVAPKLRANGAARAVDLFMTRDALTPTALGAVMSDRAARRLCDRLVDLGALRELTGRSSFRLYGV